MSLRERQADLTRSAILDAAAELFADNGESDLTMQRVADKAGVSLRTVYRHFANRRDLINGMGGLLDARFSREAGLDKDLPDRITDVVEGAHVSVAHGSTHKEMLRRGLLLAIPEGEWYTRRDDHLWSVFRAEYPHLSEAEARADFAVLRHVLNSSNVILIGERFGIEPDDLAAAMARAGRVLNDAIAARDRAADDGRSSQ